MSRRDSPSLRSFTVDDDLALQDRGAIEVTIELADGRRRWCFFRTPAAMTSCGDLIDGRRVHVGVSHGITVAGRIDGPFIEKCLRMLGRGGELESHTLPLDELV